jgi:hypothetical protein
MSEAEQANKPKRKRSNGATRFVHCRARSKFSHREEGPGEARIPRLAAVDLELASAAAH